MDLLYDDGGDDAFYVYHDVPHDFHVMKYDHVGDHWDHVHVHVH
jgi:hypothetical protein